MGEPVKIIECPRDAWQGLRAQIPPETKADYLRRLIAAGFTHIDAVSFVAPATVPQMADSERVLEILAPPESVEIIGIVVNEKGGERAIRTGAVRTLGFPYSISPEFLHRNQHQTQKQALDTLRALLAAARGAGLTVVTYLSMAFGNPYDETWSIEAVTEACDALVNLGVRQISLADTIGAAAPARIQETVEAVLAAHRDVEIGAHLHARPDAAAACIGAAFDAGCRRFDTAIGGLGGCPFAQDALVGNVATETLIAILRERGTVVPAFGSMEEASHANAEIAQTFGTRTRI